MLNPDYRDIISDFCEEKVEFLLVGAYALAVHGLPRATGDLDIWVRCSVENASRVWRALVKFGAPLSAVSEADLATPGIILQIGVVPRRIDIINTIEGVEFDDAWPSRIEVEIEGLRIPTLGRQHLIQNKRAVGRPQDVADVARLESET